MKILVADDDNSLRRVVQFKLERKDFDVTTVADGQLALDQLARGSFDLLLADIRMPKVDGIELLEQARRTRPELKVILMTAHATVSQAVQAVKLGAFDYLTKPFEDDELFIAIDKALAFGQLESENRQLRGRLRQREKAGELLGVSPAFRDMMSMVDKIAATDATVLLTGPSGTGKELIARTIHQRSNRSENEFVAVNCAAIPKELLESELFGHVKGAFTGAIKNRKGRFEVASGGTLLLDEIGDLAIDLQAKLLRVLQERTVEPVGSEQSKEIDVRVIGATNLDLQERVADGRFREDLFYRLNVVPVRVPPLAERTEDIPVLVNQFLKRFGGDLKLSLDPKLQTRLASYGWPGNVRELENLIERMVILRQSDRLTLADLPQDFGQSAANLRVWPNASTGNGVSFHEAEAQIIRSALERTGWNRTQAARELNVPRHVLVYRMKKHAITPDE